jgi:replicative DNA helicase
VTDLTLPPHDIHAEQSILGGLMLAPNAFDKIEWLRQDAFFSASHRAIYGAIRELLERGNACDALLVRERLEARGELEQAGGGAYLGTLAVAVPSAANIKRYAEIVRDKAILRALQANAMEIHAKASAPGAVPQDVAEEAEDKFLSVLDARSTGGAVPFYKSCMEAIDWMDEPHRGASTGFPDIDRIWGGMHPGDLIIVAGRPSMGKSALSFNIAEHVAAEAPVLMFSLEMTGRALGKRAIGYHAHRLGDRSAAFDHCTRLKLTIDETSAIGIGYVRAVAKRVKRQQKGLGLIVIDYLQLMTAHAEKREQEIAAISRGLKAIGKELEVPVIAVSQLNRGVEGRQDRRPMMSDLRESGAIEQDADVIAFVYREEYYVPDTPMQGVAEVITRKHREGPVGTAFLEFVPQHARFTNLDRPLPGTAEPAIPKRRTSGRVQAVDFKKQSGGDE